MRVLVLAGLFTAATIPFAAASESEIDCQAEDTRRAVAEERLDPAPAPTAPAARPTVAPREAQAQPRRSLSERRRSGKRVPDAELIGPRGAL